MNGVEDELERLGVTLVRRREILAVRVQSLTARRSIPELPSFTNALKDVFDAM